MGLLTWGDFVAHSGRVLAFKIECDSLDDDDWKCAAGMIAKVVPPFGRVVGIPRGGLKLAEALDSHCTDSPRLLIVDDVWTTGGSMREARESALVEMGTSQSLIIGAVLFARGPSPYWVIPVFRLNAGLWV